MPDREKVIAALAICTGKHKCFGCRYGQNNSDFRCQDRLMEDALALLREQEKTKVVFRQYDGSVESECGNCGLYLDKTYSVCPRCGKELDWNG